MSLPNYLQKIKSSGIYRFVWDKSEIAGVDAQILRLVVGYSDKGPFNTLVYVQSAAEFKSIFGDISKKLEKRGAYFHRLAMQCLEKGPILCLNLKKFIDEEVTGTVFNVTDSELPMIKVPVEDVYDTTRFWKLSPENAHQNIEQKQPMVENKYISFVSTDSKDASCSIIMRGYHPTGYDVTVANWFTSQSEEIPEFFEGYTDMLISDFFAEVFVFRGKFTPSLCAAEPLNRYFDIVDGEPVLKEYVVNAFGEKVDTLNLLATENASNLINSYSGCLIPFFKGSNGNYISLDLSFNSDNHLHKMMMNFDSNILYDGTITPKDIATTCWLDSQTSAFGTQLEKTEEKFTIENTIPHYDDSQSIIIGFDYKTGLQPVEGKEPTCFEANIITYEPTVVTYERVNFGGCLYHKTGEVENGGKTFEVYTADELSFAGYDKMLKKGSNFYTEDFEKINNAPSVVSDSFAYQIVHNTTDETLYGRKCNESDPNQFRLTDGNEITIDPAEYNVTAIAGYDPEVPETPDFTTFGLVIGDRVLVDGEMYTISEIASDHIVGYNADGESKDDITVFSKCNTSCSISNKNLKPIYFEGYIPNPKMAKPGLDMLSKLNWQNNILSAIVEYPGLRLGLTNSVDSEYRYIVDTFEAFVDTEVHKELALIVKEKENALGFLNFPSVKTFRDCPYTSFTDQNGKFQVKYIAEGGNKQKNPGRLFTLVSEVNGASFVSYNTPLVFSDGTVKTTVPSAAMVSNNFMDKYLSRQPYYIVAGPTYGRMIANGLVGPDFNYSRADLDILEPMGVNCMVYVPRLGTYINSNQTAKQNPKTALSLINIRELVIYLQDEVEKLLQDYQWEINTPYLHDLIKAKADVICERIQNNHGIYEFLNVCDESNNTDEVIDNEMFILSTSIEPAKGAGKMVHELTIYKKGAMKSLIR